MIGDWSTDSLVRDSAGKRERPRRMSEFPENSPAAWQELAEDAGKMAEALVAIQRDAIARARELRARELNRQPAQQLDH